MDTDLEVLRLIDEILSLGGRGLQFNRQTTLLGAVPELDSMAVIALINTLEERFGVVIEDGEISADTFASVGTLSDFVSRKLG